MVVTFHDSSIYILEMAEMDFKIVCPQLAINNINPLDWFELFTPYLPQHLEMLNIAPILKQSNEPDAACQWVLYVADRQNHVACTEVKNLILQQLEVNKPRNSSNILLESMGGIAWRITYKLVHCSCCSVFSKAELGPVHPNDFNNKATNLDMQSFYKCIKMVKCNSLYGKSS